MKNRIEVLDILRGFVILLVFIGNLEFFSGNIQNNSMLDYFVTFAIHHSIDGSIYRLFAFLFGYGFLLQVNRWGGAGFGGYWFRRMALLFAIGAIHAVFFSPLDVLTVYSIYGLMLLMVSKFRVRSLLILAFSLIGFDVALHTALLLVGAPAEILRPEPVQVYAAGGLFDVIGYNLRLAPAMILGQTVGGFTSFFSAMLLGVAAARVSLFESPNNKIFNGLFYAGVVGFFAMIIYAGVYTFDLFEFYSVGNIAYVLGAPLLACAYIVIVYQYQDGLRGYAAAGRVSLSLYVSQSVIAAAIFIYAGVYGRVSVSAQVLIGACVYIAQYAGAVWYTARYKQGLIEWFWRSAAYGKMQPIKKPAPLVAGES